MDGSGTIRVLKRDGSAEDFNAPKLAACMYRAICRRGGDYCHARDLSVAIAIYLCRSRIACISSAAIFEMTLKVLRRVGFSRAAAALEGHGARRKRLRERLRLDHGGGRVTLWQKGWLREFACRSWHLSPAVGRILAGRIESSLLLGGKAAISRREVVELLNAEVTAFGLADAVPVRQFVVES